MLLASLMSLILIWGSIFLAFKVLKPVIVTEDGYCYIFLLTQGPSYCDRTYLEFKVCWTVSNLSLEQHNRTHTIMRVQACAMLLQVWPTLFSLKEVSNTPVQLPCHTPPHKSLPHSLQSWSLSFAVNSITKTGKAWPVHKLGLSLSKPVQWMLFMPPP